MTTNLKLEVGQSWWAMSGLGDGTAEWSTEHKFEKLAEAGFSSILGRLPEDRDAEKWQRLLKAYGFSFGIQMVPFPWAGENITSFLSKAKQLGASYVNAQVLGPYMAHDEGVSGLDSLIRQAKDVGIPFYVETHRGRITQDLLRTAAYVKALPELRLTMDLSHYIVGTAIGEEGADEATERLFGELLPRTASIHARVSNGNQIQIDIGEQGEHPLVKPFAAWWREGMREWRSKAGDGDVFPFVCELGPPSYSMVDIEGKEISDRWQQALVLKRIAEDIWREL